MEFTIRTIRETETRQDKTRRIQGTTVSPGSGQ